MTVDATIAMLADNVCPERKDDFLRFATKGEEVNNFHQHLEKCARCQAAVDAAFEKSVNALQDLGKALKYAPRAIQGLQLILATLVNTHDGHGGQFEIHLQGIASIPTDVLHSIKTELEHRATFYIDGVRVQGNTLVISLCRGSIVLAKVDARWNPDRKDEKYHVIMREEIDSDQNANLPKFID